MGRAVFMDETIMEKALAGELEQEGAENVFMSELGWATYLDQNAGSSYNMNERQSMAQDGYFTADIFSNPIDVVGDWLGAVKRAVGAPLATSFMTISNDPNGARSFPKGYDEVKSRTIAGEGLQPEAAHHRHPGLQPVRHTEQQAGRVPRQVGYHATVVATLADRCPGEPMGRPLAPGLNRDPTGLSWAGYGRCVWLRPLC